MKKMNLRERIMSVTILVVVPIAYYSVVYKHQTEKETTLSKSVLEEETKLQAKVTTLADLQVKAEAARKTLDSNEDIKRYLDANKYMSNLLRKLGADQEDHGLNLKNISIEDHKKENNFYKSSMKVEVEASFVALGNFLGKLSDSETLIDVKSVELNRIDTDLKRCTATIVLHGYYNEGPKL